MIDTMVFVCVGLLFAALAIPLMRRKVPPNGVYGLRVPATFADEAVWYEANARSGRTFFAVGLTFAATAAALRLVPGIPRTAYGLICVGLLVVLVSWEAYRGNRIAEELLAAKKESESR